MQILNKYFFIVFLYSTPFLSTPNIFERIPLFFVFSAFFMLVNVLTGNRVISFRSFSDLILICFLLIGVLIPLILNSGFGQKNLTHSISWVTTAILCYFWPKEWVRLSGITFDEISYHCFLIATALATFVIFEFFLINIYGFSFSDFLPHGPIAPLGDIIDGVRRPRVFAGEPSFQAMTFEMLLPLSLQNLHKRSKVSIAIYLVLIGFVLIVLSSTASVVAMIFGFLVSSVLGGGRTNPGKFLAGFLLIAGVLVFSELRFGYISEVAVMKFEKLFLGGDGFSVGIYGERAFQYQIGFELLMDYPQGIGCGGVSEMFSNGQAKNLDLQGTGLISLFLEAAVSTGIIGFCCFAYFIYSKFVVIKSFLHQSAGKGVIFGFLSLAFHHIFVLEYWFPYFWLICALIDRVLFWRSSCLNRSHAGSNVQ